MRSKFRPSTPTTNILDLEFGFVVIVLQALNFNLRTKLSEAFQHLRDITDINGHLGFSLFSIVRRRAND